MTEQRLNVKLVAEVEKRPVLYNFKMPGYTRKDETERAWSEVGHAVGMTVAECKHRWKNLRAVFVRHIKPLKNGEVAKPKRAYYLLEAMQFTLPYIKNFNDPPDPPPKNPSHTAEEVAYDNDRFPETDSDTSRQDSEPCYPSPVPVMLQGPSAEISIIKKENDIHPEQTSTHVILPNIKRIHKTEELEMSFNDYSQAKKSRESIPPDQVNQESKAEALKMFLLSMLPDLQAMSDEEVRLFKRKSLEVIDDIISARLIPQVVYSSMSPSNTSGYKSEYIKTEDSD